MQKLCERSANSLHYSTASQMLSDVDYNMLQMMAINIIRHIGVVSKCNIQYALNPTLWE